MNSKAAYFQIYEQYLNIHDKKVINSLQFRKKHLFLQSQIAK